MELPKYSGQKSGIYHLPEVATSSTVQRWKIYLGAKYEEKRFFIDFDFESSLLDIYWWCEEHCKGVVFIKMDPADEIVIGFHEKDDAVLFKLVWGG